MNIVLVIASMLPGGAERVMSLLAEHWSKCGQSVTLITMDDGASDFYQLNKSINRISLNKLSESKNLFTALWRNATRIWMLRAKIQRINPDVVLSFMDSTNITACLALLGTKTPLVVSERTDPSKSNIGRVRNFLRPFLYRYACNAVVVQTKNVLNKCRNIWIGSNLLSISNPVSYQDSIAIGNRVGRVILSVGRLDNGKGFDVLIKAFASVASDFPEWNLQIAGEGPQRAILEEQCNRLGVGHRVSMPGTTVDIFKYYSDADIFAFASRYEGFPNALLEALAMGCACVATDCESGPREILEDGRLGILTPVDDADAMADALRKLMQDSELRRQYGSHSDYIRSRYKLESISQKWLDLFDQVKK